MGYYDPDPYHQPEKFGLTIVETEDTGGGYEFNIFTVWKHQDGRVFYAQDSGCSCPSPFEWADGLEDLTELTDWEAFAQTVKDWGYDDEPIYEIVRHNLLQAGAKALMA